MHPRLVALAGFAGSGKDTAGDELVQRLGFVKFSFSDKLYEEVSEAFGIGIGWLKDRGNKERRTTHLALEACQDVWFLMAMEPVLVGRCTVWNWPAWLWRKLTWLTVHRSPREILQWWGTEYRRQQDPDYWVKRAREFYHAQLAAGAPGLVNCSCRFVNEAEWVHAEGGTVLRIVRPGIESVNAHVSDKPLPPELVDGEVQNAGTREQLFENLLRAFSARAEAA